MTEDHIPPQCIFPKPRTTSLIKVDCCESCRKGWSKDDEEFRRFVWSAEGAEKHPSCDKAVDSIFSSIRRLESKHYKNRVVNSLEDVEAYSEGGIFLGIKPATKLEWHRIEGVLKRIVKGLFFLRNSHLIPNDHELIIKIPDLELGNELSRLPFEEIDNICDGIFRYWLYEQNDGSSTSLWLMSFCQAVWALGYIRPVRSPIP
ncbi:hypothetical protein PseudUWO311_13375 [Pseudanabaena sp. UWO311]|uniref:hypothetical protein n=1 Tax=Pseudanabaena sp. UWO311 TaxID=2487337 RepID=UPI00115979B8|nr:hypothetical protein [Pseudanabaena sp. UWO311]TYQ25934.1 hypothetical protein PseudUWO311_13375 [Pseudanabaena sp. UWO311]